MRILFIYERGPAREAISQLKECAEVIRSLREGVEIFFASNTTLDGIDLGWADHALLTPAVKVKSKMHSEGGWKHLHASGWTDPAVREVVYVTWSSLLRELKPALVIASGAHSAMLTCVFEQVPVIQVGAASLILEPSDWPSDTPFPELEDWLNQISGRTAGQLLDKPGIAFGAKSLDLQRSGLVVSARHVVQAEAPQFTPGGVLAIWDTRHHLTTQLMKKGRSLWGDAFTAMTREEYFCTPFDVEWLRGTGTLIVSNYDAYWSSQAIHLQLPHFGNPRTTQETAVARRSEAVGYSFDLGDELKMLEAFHEEPFVFTAAAEAVTAARHQEFCPLESALTYFLKLEP